MITVKQISKIFFKNNRFTFNEMILIILSVKFNELLDI